MAVPALKNKTIEEYLETERAAIEKHEYYRGEIFAMSGASLKHNRIQSNAVIEIGNRLKGKSCDVFGSDLRVHVPANTLFTYPDAVIVCDEPQLLDDAFDTLLNPTAIIEVLSPSTQSYDRGDKFALYRSIASLQEYILIHSENVAIEQYTKQENGQWLLKEYILPESDLFIQSVQLKVPIADLYHGVVFK